MRTALISKAFSLNQVNILTDSNGYTCFGLFYITIWMYICTELWKTVVVLSNPEFIRNKYSISRHQHLTFTEPKIGFSCVLIFLSSITL